jgi:DNA-directed RNA polymerase subunit RPC12/RpoP
MQTYFFELISSCSSCGNPLFLNAFTNNITCEHCKQINNIPSKLWKNIVVDSMNDAVKYQDGQKRSQKMFSGGHEVSLTFGKRKSRCAKCQTMIPDDVYGSFEGGDYKCAKCGNAISIRKPDNFVKQIVPTAMYIVAEDSAQLKTGVHGMEKPEALKPVIFTCPACAANLEIDGTKRMINCSYCNASVYLPDDLWFELHPARTVDRWYIINNEEAYVPEEKSKTDKIPEWYYLSDAAIDMKGNVYLACADDEREDFFVWSMSPDLKLRWIRKDIKLNHEHTGIAISKSNKLLLWNKFKRSLIILNSNDGTDLRTIQGDDVSDKHPYPFTLKGCDALISDSDNTILAIVNNTFVRFYDDGMRAPVWKVVSDKSEVPGLFSRLFKGGNNAVEIPSEDDWAPCVKEIGSHPKRVSGDSTKMNLGYDGYVYMYDTSSTDSKIAKYTREGEQIWKIPNPLKNVECKPYADSNGNVFLVGSDENNKTKLIKISPDGNKIITLLTDVLDGGILSQDAELALSPDGKIYTFKFYNFIKVFTPDLNCIFESDQSMAAAQEKIKYAKQRKEAEE